ncbi:DUF2017 family protein [Cryptosporangium phraense]|uniref:DUF2017 domain-containing protein n=1 Tax=Cryptosporangium phraense TaxID=2593070 RepID=A0A545AQP9_9ACTN|nr:DUF2017 family protein [Cryptosporangium phraense]TQS43638.1 DUF2017 domain-containing protein [Cryptosporangium phraense]
MTYGFTRSKNAFTLRLSAEEAQAVGLVVAQVAGLIQAGDRRGVMSLDLGPSSLGRAEPLGRDPFDVGGRVPREAGDVFDDFDAPEPDDGESDPVLARLFPDGYRDDPEAAAELRSLTESSLREQKIGNASVILDDLPFEGGEIRLEPERAEAWLLALNDARLMLGTALEIEAETDPLAELEAAAGADPTGARVLGLSLYQFLTGLQASLVDAIDPE